MFNNDNKYSKSIDLLNEVSYISMLMFRRQNDDPFYLYIGTVDIHNQIQSLFHTIRSCRKLKWYESIKSSNN